MLVSLSFEKSFSEDVAIMVDVLRASTTITVALDKFSKVMAVKDKTNAMELAKKYDAVLAGEREGAKIEGFDTGNSPVEIKKFHGDCLVLTTSNGTRILEGMKAKALVGSFINAEAVAKKALEIAENHIEIVMAGVNGKFAIEDFLGAGEIISNLTDYKLDEMALSAYMASRNENMVNKAVKNSDSALKLKKLGYSEDITFCINKNLYSTVPLYQNGIIKKL
ncbi:MAG: 2-phosphosulfolactate phosphatase [Methanobacterium sp.]|uniref:2-phosphosulfolactate phosphatase n=1 Tax=Methanobacterium sp. TaxID=2164 RepID=UPI003D654B2B|nr:2-phosphosulfolactate phosphatase [Methanobacterium sp.]